MEESIIHKILIGGSPCTHWSISQTKDRETEPNGIGWELFKNYLIAREKYLPDYFLYENNKSMSPIIRAQITKELGVEPILINSALLSAQSRLRLYWTNIPCVEQPTDKRLCMNDLASDNDYVSYNGGAMTRTKPDLQHKHNGLWQIGHTDKNNGQACRVYDPNGKCVTIRGSAGGGGAKTGLYMVDSSICSLSLSCVRKMQTIPKSIKFTCKDQKAIDLIGNGWTVDVIAHIMSYIPDIATKQLDVLSMYDGISCGHMALNKLGVDVQRYYATEIDESAIKTTQYNFPDTIQLGDAFQVRDDNWKIG